MMLVINHERVFTWRNVVYELIKFIHTFHIVNAKWEWFVLALQANWQPTIQHIHTIIIIDAQRNTKHWKSFTSFAGFKFSFRAKNEGIINKDGNNRVRFYSNEMTYMLIAFSHKQINKNHFFDETFAEFVKYSSLLLLCDRSRSLCVSILFTLILQTCLVSSLYGLKSVMNETRGNI